MFVVIFIITIIILYLFFILILPLLLLLPLMTADLSIHFTGLKFYLLSTLSFFYVLFLDFLVFSQCFSINLILSTISSSLFFTTLTLFEFLLIFYFLLVVTTFIFMNLKLINFQDFFIFIITIFFFLHYSLFNLVDPSCQFPFGFPPTVAVGIILS